jgi:hypothetical protein
LFSTLALDVEYHVCQSLLRIEIMKIVPVEDSRLCTNTLPLTANGHRICLTKKIGFFSHHHHHQFLPSKQSCVLDPFSSHDDNNDDDVLLLFYLKFMS